MMASRIGWYAAWIMPSARARENNRPMESRSNQARKNNRKACSIIMIWAITAMVLRLKRSATTPNMGVMKISGAISTKATAATQNSDSDSTQASQDTARRCIQNPIRETLFPLI